MKINWKRIFWLIFIILYTALFFYNCLRPFNYWLFSYLYTMLLIVWLGIEYYQKHLFFQSGFLPSELYRWPLRALFALFFYSSFVIGISTVVWWYGNQIPLYPFVQILGLAGLLCSISVRWRAYKTDLISAKPIAKFYLSIFLLMLSLMLGYGSYFLLGYVLIIGSLLIYMQYRHEEKIIVQFEKYVNSKHKNGKIESQDYKNLWAQYLETRLKKKR